MTRIDVFLVVLNCIGAGASAVINFLASRHMTNLKLRRGHRAIALLSLVYVVAYVILVFNQEHFRGWQQTMRVVGLFVWSIVWIRPAVVLVEVSRQLNRATAYDPTIKYGRRATDQ